MSRPGPEMLRALVVDDEPAARKLLTDLLAEVPDVEPVGTCHNGREALRWLETHHADLLFLDIEMPGLGGFDVVDGLPPDTPENPRPAVVFVTAHDEYAIRAFEVRAWDYLLKPFDGERLSQVLARLRERLSRQLPAEDARPDDRPRLPRTPLRRLAIPQGRGRVNVRLADVLWIQAESNYVRFHLRGTSYLARMSLKNLEAQLDPEAFARVHRSAIVNVEHVERMDPRGHGDLALTLRGEHEVTLSRRYRGRFERLLASLP